MNFVKDYYELIFDKENTLSPETIKELGQTEVILGEIIPYFFTESPVKNFELSFEIPINELLGNIQDYILSYREDKFEEGDNHTIIVVLIHKLFD
jgi:hypothetical protein